MKTTVSGAPPSFSRVAGRAPPGAPAGGARCGAALGRRWARPRSTQARKQRRGGQGHHAEHPMAPHLGRAPHAPPAAAVAFLEQTVDPPGRAAFLESLRRRRGQRDFLPPAGFGSMIGTWPSCVQKAWLCGASYALSIRSERERTRWAVIWATGIAPCESGPLALVSTALTGQSPARVSRCSL